MKKYLVSAGLVVVSLIYVLFQHGGRDDDTVAAIQPPTGLSNTATSTVQAGIPFASSTAAAHPKPASTPAPTPRPVGMYRDGSYIGTVADAYYGYIQVKAIISGGKLTDVQVLQNPNDRETSRYINSQALPYLQQEAIAAQSAKIDTISGASDTSAAYKESLSSALAKAKA